MLCTVCHVSISGYVRQEAIYHANSPIIAFWSHNRCKNLYNSSLTDTWMKIVNDCNWLTKALFDFIYAIPMELVYALQCTYLVRCWIQCAFMVIAQRLHWWLYTFLDLFQCGNRLTQYPISPIDLCGWQQQQSNQY